MYAQHAYTDMKTNARCNWFQLCYIFLLVLKEFLEHVLNKKPEIKINQGKINLVAKKNRLRFHNKQRCIFKMNFKNASKFNQHAIKWQMYILYAPIMKHCSKDKLHAQILRANWEHDSGLNKVKQSWNPQKLHFPCIKRGKEVFRGFWIFFFPEREG